jgi:hypothetical protein
MDRQAGHNGVYPFEDILPSVAGTSCYRASRPRFSMSPLRASQCPFSRCGSDSAHSICLHAHWIETEERNRDNCYLNNVTQLPGLKSPSKFDRVVYRCSTCGEEGVILSTYLRADSVALEGACLKCGRTTTSAFDLQESDRYLRGEADNICPVTLEKTVVTKASCPKCQAKASCVER